MNDLLLELAGLVCDWYGAFAQRVEWRTAAAAGLAPKVVERRSWESWFVPEKVFLFWKFNG